MCKPSRSYYRPKIGEKLPIGGVVWEVGAVAQHHVTLSRTVKTESLDTITISRAEYQARRGLKRA